MKKINKFIKLLIIPITSLFVIIIASEINSFAQLNCYSFNDCFNKGYYSKDPDEQIEYYTKALEKWSYYNGYENKAIIYNNRGIAYKNKGEYDKAIEDYNKAIELNPNYADAYNNRGTAYLDKGEYDKAIEDYNKAIELNPNDAIAYNNRGLAYKNKGEYDKAIQDYNKAIELNPKDEYPVANMAEVFYMQGKLDKSLEYLNKSLEMKEESNVFRYVYWLKTLIYKEKKDKTSLNETIKDAEEFLNKMISKNPKDADNYASLSNIYCEAKINPKKALELAKKSIELKKDSERYYILARAYLLNGKTKKAIENFKKSIKLNPNNCWALYWLGKTYKYNLKDTKSAQNYFKKCLEINPKFRPVVLEMK